MEKIQGKYSRNYGIKEMLREHFFMGGIIMGKIKLSTKLYGIAVIVLSIMLFLGIFSLLGMQKKSDEAPKELETKIRGNYDLAIKEQVDNAISVIDTYYQSSQNGKLTLDEAKNKPPIHYVNCATEMADTFGQMIQVETTLYCLEAKQREQIV